MKTTIDSNALKANLFQMDLEIDPEYTVIREVMSKYYGLLGGVETFLKELSHPLKNFPFIVNEARGYALNYFHLLKTHPKGPDAANRYIRIFRYVIENAVSPEVQADAADNLLLFLQKVIKEAGPERILNFLPVLNDAFHWMAHAPEPVFFLFVKSYYRVEKLAEGLLAYSPDDRLDLEPLRMVVTRYFRETYAYWLNVEDPLTWFEKEMESGQGDNMLARIFENISHDTIQSYQERLEGIGNGQRPLREVMAEMVTLPGYNQIVDRYREIPLELQKAGAGPQQGNRWKVIFLFHIMNISGLGMIHEEALREINRTLTWLIEKETSSTYIEKLIAETFAILSNRTREFPATALGCVLNMGKGIYKTIDIDLVKTFINAVSDLGFQDPMIGGVSNDWQIQANSAHILNIRTWLELIEQNPKWSTRLLSDLIIHLSISGVFIKDTDLFPRDITKLLNSDIGPVYNLVKQLARIFPTYFNDIGAEGRLRDISTEIDEITNRKDRLIHFLRKQVHVESSNRVLTFMEAVFRFWRTRDKSHVERFVPPDIFHQIHDAGEFVDGVHRIVNRLETYDGIELPGPLLHLTERETMAFLEDIQDVGERDKKRVALAMTLYRQLHYKYTLVMEPRICDEINDYLNQLKTEAFPSLDELRGALAEPDAGKKLPMLITYLEALQKLILSPQTFESREDIYKKRHFTIDIPSMYGSYHEMKFDALGLTFRIETIVNVCFEEIVERIDLKLITHETFYRILDLLHLFYRALKLDGMFSVEMENQLELLDHALKTRGFTFTQYLDIFKGFARAVKNIINDNFNNTHKNNLNRILDRLPPEAIQRRFLPQSGVRKSELASGVRKLKLSPDDDAVLDPEKRNHRVSEVFLRDRIASSLGLQQLDRFLGRILNTLFTTQSYRMPDARLRMLLNYDPQRAIVSITDPAEGSASIILLGNKGNNLVKLNRLGLPVPPGFIITTEVFRSWEVVRDFPPAQENFKKQIRLHIGVLERQTGKRFADPANPLLFSVRSGSSISQPGMMDTFLNVGINEAIAAGLAEKTGNPWFAWDNYRRFLQCYGMSFGLNRDDFDLLMREFKEQNGVPYKRNFTGIQMRELAMIYKERIRAEGIDIEEDPFRQLLITIRKVLQSWDSPKAKTYRSIIGISDDWGTAVTVQSMVYGNLSERSGTGVFFTHNPKWSEDNLRLWGDFTVGNQGEDVVSGLVETLPVSIIQQEYEKRNADIILEIHFPEIYATIKAWANDLIYKRGWNPQEMEFTFEGPTPSELYLLQTRNMAIRERKKVISFAAEEVNGGRRLLANGIGVSGGAMSGRTVFTLEEIDRWRKEEPDTHLILLRGDTVPDDIREINAADGLLTARGGVTSHAAVVAHRLGKTGVVGCNNMVCNEPEKSCRFADVTIKSGDFISIHGHEGLVYEGFLKVETL